MKSNLTKQIQTLLTNHGLNELLPCSWGTGRTSCFCIQHPAKIQQVAMAVPVVVAELVAGATTATMEMTSGCWGCRYSPSEPWNQREREEARCLQGPIEATLQAPSAAGAPDSHSLSLVCAPFIRSDLESIESQGFEEARGFTMVEGMAGVGRREPEKRKNQVG